jgi:hypothetical protein
VTKVLAKAKVGLNNPGGTNIQAGPRVEGSLENSPVFLSRGRAISWSVFSVSSSITRPVGLVVSS